MPLLLPSSPLSGISLIENVSVEVTSHSHRLEKDINVLLRTALHAKRSPRPLLSASFGQLLVDILKHHLPALLERTRKFANQASCNTLIGHLSAACSASHENKVGAEEIKGRCRRARCLYIMQHEWAVVGPGDKIDYIVSDDATTCHLVGIREPCTGVVGLAHVDAVEVVPDLVAVEDAVQKESMLRLGRHVGNAPGGYRRPTEPLTLDLFLVGGYEGDSEGGLLTAAILQHFQSTSVHNYNLQLALVSSLNTCTLPSAFSSSSMTPSVPAPLCRSLGFVIEPPRHPAAAAPSKASGSCDLFGAHVLTGDVPESLRGPMRTLRALRLWGRGSRRLVQVRLAHSLGEAEEAVFDQEDIANSSRCSRPQPKSVPSFSCPPSAPSASNSEVSIVINPFRFRCSEDIKALACLEDEALKLETSTSPAIESPFFVSDIRAVLKMNQTAFPEDFFGPRVLQPLLVPLHAVEAATLLTAESKGGEERRGNRRINVT